MERIVIIGCGGSGKSTLARQLGEILTLPVVHLDKLYWYSGWQESTAEEFDAKLAAELEKSRWIMDGNFSRTIPQRLAKCDTVIYLDYNRFVCLWGVICRVIKSYGKSRPDMGEGCPERFDWDFIKWVWNFNNQNRENNYRCLNTVSHAETFAFKNRRQLREFLRQLQGDVK